MFKSNLPNALEALTLLLADDVQMVARSAQSINTTGSLLPQLNGQKTEIDALTMGLKPYDLSLWLCFYLIIRAITVSTPQI